MRQLKARHPAVVKTKRNTEGKIADSTHDIFKPFRRLRRQVNRNRPVINTVNQDHLAPALRNLFKRLVARLRPDGWIVNILPWARAVVARAGRRLVAGQTRTVTVGSRVRENVPSHHGDQVVRIHVGRRHFAGAVEQRHDLIAERLVFGHQLLDDPNRVLSKAKRRKFLSARKIAPLFPLFHDQFRVPERRKVGRNDDDDRFVHHHPAQNLFFGGHNVVHLQPDALRRRARPG